MGAMDGTDTWATRDVDDDGDVSPPRQVPDGRTARPALSAVEVSEEGGSVGSAPAGESAAEGAGVAADAAMLLAEGEEYVTEVPLDDIIE